MRGAILLAVLVGLSGPVVGQGLQERMIARDARINALYAEENYAEVLREIDLLEQEAEGTAWEDSLYTFTYKLGRAAWKSQGADAGVAAAERLCERVQSRDASALHQVKALADLGLLYYHLGRMADCTRVDSTASALAELRKLPVTIRGKAKYRLALDHSSMGEHELAIQRFLEAKAIYGSSDTLLGLNLAETCNGLGASSWHLGRTREAEVYYNEALKNLGDSQDIDHLLRKTSTLGNMGILWQTAGDFARSRTYYQQSLQACNEVIAQAKDPAVRDGAILNRAKGYLNLATVYFAVGDDGRAAELLDLSLRDRRTILEPNDPQLLRVQDRMASLEMAAGDLDHAEKHVAEYMKACGASYGRTSEDYIMAASKLADITAQQGHTERADSLFRESIALATSLADAATDPGLAVTYKRRAQMYEGLGRNEAAVADLLRARAILVRIHGADHYRVAECDALLAEAAFGAGDVASAHQYSLVALEQLSDRVDALSKTTVPQTLPEPGLLPDALYWNIRTERATPGNEARSRKWSSDLDLAIRALDRNKLALGDRASQLQLIGSQKRLFNLALDVAYDAYSQSGEETDVDRFLAISEADRSILLKNRLNEFAGMSFAGVPDSILEQEQQLLFALDIDPEDRATTLELPEKEKEYTDLLKRIEHDYPEYYALRYGETRVGLKEVRQDLVTPTRDLLLYAMTDDHLYILVARQDTTVLMRVANAGVREAVKAMNTAIFERKDDAYAKAAHELYTLVFAPVEPLLKNTELLIIPDGPLHNVNFEVLLDTPSTAHDYRANLLIQRYAIAYLLSATTAMQFAHLEKHRSEKVLALAPGFSDDLKQHYLADVKDSAMIDRQYLQLVRQPFAVQSAEQLGGLLSAHVMVGSDANEVEFRKHAKEYNILHLGTHAEMNPTSPLYSKLVLSKNGAGTAADADGYLHAFEIYELDLNAQLAVLTACETGAGNVDNGEGVRSLGYSFAYAGCPSLVISLWSIDEKVSSEIITRFYENLADGMPKHLALRQAKLDHLANAPEELASPYYWAGMVLVGDVAPVTLSAWKRYAPWYIGGALVLAVLGWGVWRRSRMDRLHA